MRKPHPLKGKKKSPESIAKRVATFKRNREKRALEPTQDDEPLPKQRRKRTPPDTRSFEQLQRDVGEAVWCLKKAVTAKRREIAASLADVTDEETYMYMAMRYLEGGLKP